MEQLKNAIDSITNLDFINLQFVLKIIEALIIILVFRIFSSLLSIGVLKIFHIKKSKEEIKQTPYYKALRTFFRVLGIYIATMGLGFSAEVFAQITKIFKIIVILLIANLVANFVDGESKFIKNLQSKIINRDDGKILNFIGKVLRTLVYIVAVFIIMKEIGYDLSGLITGLGLGSVLIALAAQDLAKNLFGGATVFFDRPFIIGDWIKTATCEGTVEDITFRSTRLKNWDNLDVVIPNSVLVNDYIINYSRLQRRRININLNLGLQTPSETMEKIIKRLKIVLENTENVISNTVRISCDEIDEKGINLFIYLYTEKVKYDEYLQVKNKLHIIILEILEKENIKLAYPGIMLNQPEEEQGEV